MNRWMLSLVLCSATLIPTLALATTWNVPGNHPDGVDCGTIGAHGMGCGGTAVEQTTWGRFRAGYP